VPLWLESSNLPIWRRLWSLVGHDPADEAAQKATVFDWRLAIIAFSVLALLAVVLHLGVWGWPKWRAWRMRQIKSSHKSALGPPDFYVRLLGQLAKLNLRRRSGQTAQELATAARLRLVASPESSTAARLPDQIVAAYYRVRFGGAALDKNEQEAIEQALSQIVSAVHHAQS
jgi:hypothetical protein